MVITLFLVTFIASSALGLIYEITKEPIAEAALQKKVKAIQKVVPSFTNDPIKESFTVESDIGALQCYPAKENGETVGVAIETMTPKGFSGQIKLMVGFLPDYTIYDTAVLAHKETPGLGDKIDKQKSDFSEQFQKKNPSSFDMRVTKDGGDVDAITAATISSRAFCDAMRRAYQSIQGNL